jgi:site-specific DNA-methyltransferase (adenine-specific)
LILGDCLAGLRALPGALVDLTVTSPPFGGLRWFRLAADVFEGVAAELWRVTKPGGVVCWNEGDQASEPIPGTTIKAYSGLSWRHALHFQDLGFSSWDVIITGCRGIRWSSDYKYLRPPQYVFVLGKGKPRTVKLLSDRANVTAGKTNRPSA